MQNGFSTQQKFIGFKPCSIQLTSRHIERLNGLSQDSHLSLLVQAVDKTAVVELFDQAYIDEVFGPGGASFRVLFAELGERFFDRF